MSSVQGLSVFLLEDEFLIALEAEEMLQSLGAKSVTVASNINQAGALIGAGHFDIAVLDVNVNGTMSFPVAEALKAKGVPVLFATGYELKSRRMTADDTISYITKPYTAERLEKGIAKVLAEQDVLAR